MARLIVLTGASGILGRVLAPRLSRLGYALRLSDLNAFPDRLPENAEFIHADLVDEAAIGKLVAGSEAILHFGGVNGERPFRQVMESNLLGLTHVFEAARQGRQRVIFASSNHTIGYYERGVEIGASDPPRPDGYYGLSKVYGEMLGQMMLYKHGIESVHLRIGSCLPRPSEARHLSTWLSYDDFERLIVAALETPSPGHAIVWGVSANTASWWKADDAARIGYFPQDNAARFTPLDEVGDPISRRYQGGSIAALGYTRDDGEQ
jgi:uronate dehydrogenase